MRGRIKYVLPCIVWVVLASIWSGCGKGGADKSDEGNVGVGDSLTAVKTVELDHYVIDIPAGYQIIRDSLPLTEALDGSADEIRSDDGSRVIIYSTKEKIDLSLQAMLDFASRINGEGYLLNTLIDSYKIIRFDEIRAMLLVGTWQSEDEQGELRAVGFECGGRSYLVEALFTGAWEEKTSSIYNSFHCTED